MRNRVYKFSLLGFAGMKTGFTRVSFRHWPKLLYNIDLQCKRMTLLLSDVFSSHTLLRVIIYSDYAVMKYLSN